MKKALLTICLAISAALLPLGVACQEPTPTPNTPNQETPELPNEEMPEPPKEETLMITAPRGEVFPYVAHAKAYLEEGAGADVTRFAASMNNPQVPVQVKWEYSGDDASACRVEYATNADFSDAITVETAGDTSSVDLYNLYRGSEYFVRVTVLGANGETLKTAESQFETTALGPRVMNIEGIYNVRDVGGYQTLFGKEIVQGLAYRGGSLTPPPKDIYNSNLTENGKRYMSEVMGIKTEIDFRNAEESGVTGGSVIPNAELVYATLGGYEDAMGNYKEGYRKTFSMLADENNYPIYYHCTGGADRTGTVTFLLHALLGVSETECIQDYEFTSFSVYGVRSTQSGPYVKYFQPFLNRLKAFEGDTLQEQTENFLLSIGVTEDEIFNVKAIFFGEPTRASVSAPKAYQKNADGDLVLSVVGAKTPSKLYLGGVETEFSYADGKMTVKPERLPAIENGTCLGKVTFTDGTEVEFSFAYSVWNVVDMDGLLPFDEQGIWNLTADKTAVYSEEAIGYGKVLRIHMQTTTVANTSGGLRVFLGSYGFECRGGEVRPYTVDANGTMAEVARNAGMGLYNTFFDGGATLYLSVEFVDDKPVLSIKAGTENGWIEHRYVFPNRVANEIADGDAKACFWIRTDAVTSLQVYRTSVWAERN